MSECAPIVLEDAHATLGSAPQQFTTPPVTLRVERGGIAACVGPSGSGKTTIVRMVAGLVPPASGVVRTAGTEPHALSQAARRAWRLRTIGLVFQDFALLGHLTALQNITLPYALGLPKDPAARTRAQALAESLEIEHTLARKPAKLSHGERQRVAVCRALITQPSVILCDEPTASLDDARSRLVLDALDHERETRSATVLIATHDQFVCERIGQQISLRDTRMAEHA